MRNTTTIADPGRARPAAGAWARSSSSTKARPRSCSTSARSCAATSSPACTSSCRWSRTCASSTAASCRSTTPPERYLTAEKKDVEVDFFVKWRISDVATFYRAASGGDEGAATRAPDADRQERAAQRDQPARPAGGGVQRPLRPDRAPAQDDQRRRRRRSASRCVDVRIKRINLPQDSNILESVFDRMRAERSQVANQLRAEGTQAARGHPRRRRAPAPGHARRRRARRAEAARRGRRAAPPRSAAKAYGAGRRVLRVLPQPRGLPRHRWPTARR